jgi:hypothetical protein
MIGGEPAVQDSGNGDATLVEDEDARRFLAAVTGVTLDAQHGCPTPRTQYVRTTRDMTR